jgi:hypothetical protein
LYSIAPGKPREKASHQEEFKKSNTVKLEALKVVLDRPGKTKKESQLPRRI